MLGAGHHRKNPQLAYYSTYIDPSIINLIATSKSTSSIEIKWDYDPGSSLVNSGISYKVEITSPTTASALELNKSHTFTGLTLGQTYAFKVSTTINNKLIFNTVILKLQYNTEPSAPPNFSVASLKESSGKLKFDWGTTSDNGSAITEFKIEYKFPGSTAWNEFKSGISPTSVSIITFYDSFNNESTSATWRQTWQNVVTKDVVYRLSAKNSIGWGTPSDEKTVHVYGHFRQHLPYRAAGDGEASRVYNGTTYNYTTMTGKWVVPASVYAIERVCLVAGGGGGGNIQGGGGGGAGEVMILSPSSETFIAVNPGDTIDYVVGNGGQGGLWTSTSAQGLAQNGFNTSITFPAPVNTTYTAKGGGAGGGIATNPNDTLNFINDNGYDGGSGGGGGSYLYGQDTNGGNSTKSSNVAGSFDAYGEKGGKGKSVGVLTYGGGGGGALGVGGSGVIEGNTSTYQNAINGGTGFLYTPLYSTETFNPPITVSSGGQGSKYSGDGSVYVQGTTPSGYGSGGGGGPLVNRAASGQPGIIIIEYYL